MKLREELSQIKCLLSVALISRNWWEIIAAIAKGRQPASVRLRNGIRIDAPLDNSIFDIVYEIFFRNVYTQDLPIEPNDVVMDIGANIGIFTLFAASRTQNTIYAFEPFPDNVEFLTRNIRLNGFPNVITHTVAVSDKIGFAKLFLSNVHGGHLLIDNSGEGGLENYLEVPTTTLQRIIDDYNLKQIDFLKLDCEGSEGLILNATPRECLRRVRKIAIEFHDNVSLLKHDQIQRLLKEAGFATKLKWNRRTPFGYIYGSRDGLDFALA